MRVGFPGTERQNGDEKLGTLSQFRASKRDPHSVDATLSTQHH